MVQQGYYIKFFVGETLLYNDKFVWIGRVIFKKDTKIWKGYIDNDAEKRTNEELQ